MGKNRLNVLPAVNSTPPVQSFAVLAGPPLNVPAKPGKTAIPTGTKKVVVSDKRTGSRAGKFNIAGELAYCPQLNYYATATGGTTPMFILYGGLGEYMLSSNFGLRIAYNLWTQTWEFGSYYDSISKTYKPATMTGTVTFMFPHLVYYSRSSGPTNFYLGGGMVSAGFVFTTNIPGYTYPFTYMPTYYYTAGLVGVRTNVTPKLAAYGELRAYADIILYLGGVSYTF